MIKLILLKFSSQYPTKIGTARQQLILGSADHYNYNFMVVEFVRTYSAKKQGWVNKLLGKNILQCTGIGNADLNYRFSKKTSNLTLSNMYLQGIQNKCKT